MIPPYNGVWISEHNPADKQTQPPDWAAGVRIYVRAQKPSPLGKVDFSAPPRAMKKTEEVLPQYGLAED